MSGSYGLQRHMLKFPVIHFPDTQDFLYTGVPRFILSSYPVGGPKRCASNNLSDPSIPSSNIQRGFHREMWLKPPLLIKPTRKRRGECQGAMPVGSRPWLDAEANSRSTHPFCSMQKATEGIFKGETLKAPAIRRAGHCPGF